MIAATEKQKKEVDAKPDPVVKPPAGPQFGQ